MASSKPGNRVCGVLTLLLGMVLGGDVALAVLPAASRDLPQPAQTILETRLRSEPSLRSDPLLRLPAGATVYLQGIPENGWYRTQHGALQGYLRSGDVATVILQDEDDASSAAVTDAENGDAPDSVALEQRAASNNKKKSRPSKETRRKRRKEQRELEAALRIVAATDLNLRDAPGEDAPVLTTLPRTQAIAPTGEEQDGGWR
jgi:hypothetical protein